VKLVVALDLPSLKENLALVRAIQSSVDGGLDDIWLKIGLRSFIRDGFSAIEYIKNISNRHKDFKIFLDLKLYDIPNTMTQAAIECAKLGVDMISVHASAGFMAMNNLILALDEGGEVNGISGMSETHNVNIKRMVRPLVFCVSALTSFSDEEFQSVYNTSIVNGVENLSSLAHRAGVDGIICSVRESAMIKRMFGDTFLTLTPAIRPNINGDNITHDDQQRVASINDAKAAKADFIVIGRPIYSSNNPAKAVSLILKEMGK